MKIYDNVKLAMIACTHINGYNMVEANFKCSAVPKVACLWENIFFVDEYGTCLSRCFDF